MPLIDMKTDKPVPSTELGSMDKIGTGETIETGSKGPISGGGTGGWINPEIPHLREELLKERPDAVISADGNWIDLSMIDVDKNGGGGGAGGGAVYICYNGTYLNTGQLLVNGSAGGKASGRAGKIGMVRIAKYEGSN